MPRFATLTSREREVLKMLAEGNSVKEIACDLNLSVKPGETVAIVGPTGAGKTTLVNLLMRFYEIDEGRICIDGIDSREMSRDELRSTFGMVL